MNIFIFVWASLYSWLLLFKRGTKKEDTSLKINVTDVRLQFHPPDGNTTTITLVQLGSELLACCCNMLWWAVGRGVYQFMYERTKVLVPPSHD